MLAILHFFPHDSSDCSVQLISDLIRIYHLYRPFTFLKICRVFWIFQNMQKLKLRVRTVKTTILFDTWTSLKTYREGTSSPFHNLSIACMKLFLNSITAFQSILSQQVNSTYPHFEIFFLWNGKTNFQQAYEMSNILLWTSWKLEKQYKNSPIQGIIFSRLRK